MLPSEARPTVTPASVPKNGGRIGPARRCSRSTNQVSARKPMRMKNRRRAQHGGALRRGKQLAPPAAAEKEQAWGKAVRPPPKVVERPAHRQTASARKAANSHKARGRARICRVVAPISCLQAQGPAPARKAAVVNWSEHVGGVSGTRMACAHGGTLRPWRRPCNRGHWPRDKRARFPILFFGDVDRAAPMPFKAVNLAE